MAVIKLAVHPINVDLCSGSTVVYLLGSRLIGLGFVVVAGEEVARLRSLRLASMPRDMSGLDARRGARKGDLGGSAIDGLEDPRSFFLCFGNNTMV